MTPLLFELLTSKCLMLVIVLYFPDSWQSFSVIFSLLQNGVEVYDASRGAQFSSFGFNSHFPDT